MAVILSGSGDAGQMLSIGRAQVALSVVSSAYILQGDVIALHSATEESLRDSSIRQLHCGGESDGYVETGPGSEVLPIVERGDETAMSAPFLPGVTSRMFETPRLRTHTLTAGADGGAPVVLVHGNVSSARFFEETLLALPQAYWGIAPDLRGFGASETKPVDARRGLRDFADDLHALFTTVGLVGGRRPHLLGWSMGGGVVMQYAIDHPDDVASLTLLDPVSPFGYGGTKDAQGSLCWPDGAGSGGGTANPDYVQRLKSGDRGEDSPNSPRNVLNAFYFKPPFRAAPSREEVYLDEILRMVVGDENYPGDGGASPNWPGVGPGARGVNNAMSPLVCNLSGFAAISPQPSVLWMRGADDQIVADTSLLDFGTLGSLGYVPGWPGADVFPSQPMVAQIRAVLDRYRATGGKYDEVVIADCGHSPLIEKPEEFRARFFAFLDAASGH
jgi:pimeloyl-ACP methyl ester carboxylesterase